MINLVYDDTHTNADTVYLTLYHNAYSEVPVDNNLYLYRGIGKSSFKVADLLPQGVQSKPFRLNWVEYDGNFNPVKRSGTLVFQAGGTESDKSLSKSTGIDNSIEVK